MIEPTGMALSFTLSALAFGSSSDEQSTSTV